VSLLFAACLAVIGCDSAEPPAHLRIAGGDAERGRQLIRYYGCGACHRIEGIQGARGVVGPPLLDYAQRTMLAGRMPNVPRNLVPWLIDPPALAPQTGMPNLGVSEAQARDIATYLYTLGADGARAYPPEALLNAEPRGIVERAPATTAPAN
jgi:mono/diheme cytochrome c family protein